MTMKRTISILYIIAGLFLFPAFMAKGQTTGSFSLSGLSSSEMIREHIFLFTDRALYAVNENILFKIEYLIENNIHKQPWSTVIYVELIRQDGHPLVQRKYPLTEKGAKGNILIPEDVPSGIYFLKAYTKWMRNFRAEGYEYKPIKIINPFTDQTESISIPKDSVQSAKWYNIQRDSVFKCFADKERVKKREKVSLSFSINKGIDFQREVSVSVCKKGSNEFSEGYSGSNSIITPLVENPEYFPEPRGISISGKVIHKDTRQEVPYANVHLAMLNKNSFYAGFISNSRGQFLATFPFSEDASDFYMEADKENLPLSLQMDNEFCSKLFSPGTIPFELTESEKEIAKEICINMQINKMNVKTQNADTIFENQDKKISSSFYGKPDRVIFTKSYVKLTNVREFFFELVPEFIIETKNKIPVLKLAKITSLVDFPPLCLIDNVPVTDMGKFLNISMEKIERIEIIDKAYIAGNILYNGVVQAFSKNRDMGGIELSKNSMFFNFNLYSGAPPVYAPDYSVNSSLTRIPDRRNTLYWNPSLKLKGGQEQKISFYTADMNGEYEILIQGLSTAGEKITLRKACFVVE
jgi:hypothetical protein